MRRYAITMADGTLSIMFLIDEEATPKDEIKKWAPESRDSVVGIAEINDLPEDRTFRNAWKVNGASVECDMDKAREIQRDRMRLARAPLLSALDVEQLRGLDVEKEKQALRDVTADPAIDAARTPEELKAVWPECLN